MFVGYSVHHANDVHRMLKINTKSILQSCDIIWLNEAYDEWIDRKVLQKKKIDDEDDDFIANSKIQEVNDSQDKLSSVQDQDELKKKKIYRAMRLLESSFNPEASTVLQNIEQEREILLEQANIALFNGIVIDEKPSSFDEAWNHDDPKARGKWQDCIKKELCDMDEQHVWKIINKEDIPENR
jgi:DNA-binding phage protein